MFRAVCSKREICQDKLFDKITEEKQFTIYIFIYLFNLIYLAGQLINNT